MSAVAAALLGSRDLADETARILLEAWPKPVAEPLAEEIRNVMRGLRGDVLRRSVNLPPGTDYLHDKEFEEPHRRGEVLVAAILNAFLDAWSDRLHALDAAWVAGTPPVPGTRLAAKTRYRQGDAACTVVAVDGAQFDLAFDDPQWAVTPGQSAVLYAGEVCLGGGVITQAG